MNIYNTCFYENVARTYKNGQNSIGLPLKKGLIFKLSFIYKDTYSNRFVYYSVINFILAILLLLYFFVRQAVTLNIVSMPLPIVICETIISSHHSRSSYLYAARVISRAHGDMRLGVSSLIHSQCCGLRVFLPYRHPDKNLCCRFIWFIVRKTF